MKSSNCIFASLLVTFTIFSQFNTVTTDAKTTLALHRRQNLQVIIEGEYSQGPTDGGITVKGKKHRMCGEGACSKWESISTLKAVRPGVIFRNGVYWCLWSEYNQFLKKTNRTWASCQSEGWSGKYLNN